MAPERVEQGGQIPAGGRKKRLKHYVGDISTGPSYFKQPVFIVELKMAPGATILPHDHDSHIVVTLGLEGECQYTHYELGAGAPADRRSKIPFTVSATRRGLLTPGRVSTLAQTRDNVHTFTAGAQGATILDFTTTVAMKGMGSRLAIDPKPTTPGGRNHRARWDQTRWVEK